MIDNADLYKIEGEIIFIDFSQVFNSFKYDLMFGTWRWPFLMGTIE